MACHMSFGQNVIYFQKLSENAILPTRQTTNSAGLDLSSPVDITIFPGFSALIKLDLKMQLPFGTFGKIEERSGLALFHNIIVKGGVIDQDYAGNVGVILFNHGPQEFEVKRGDRIAQLVIQPYVWPSVLIEVKNLDVSQAIAAVAPVQSTTQTRGTNGFGSTGSSPEVTKKPLLTYTSANDDYICILEPTSSLIHGKDVKEGKFAIRSAKEYIIGPSEIASVEMNGSFIIRYPAQGRLCLTDHRKTSIIPIGALRHQDFPGSLTVLIRNITTGIYVIPKQTILCTLFIEKVDSKKGRI